VLERGAAFSPDELECLDTQCMMLAPLLAQRRAAQRSLVQHARASVRGAVGHWFDDSFLGWKFVAAAAVLLLVLSALVPIPFRVTAPSVVEGEVQRSAAAPFQGFIRQAHVRAGDVVRSGQVLATLEDKDLQLERARWEADLEVALRKEREAMAAANRVEVRLAGAQANQARAQLELAQEKLKRVQITAPFDGVVVRGDLSQQLGSPVEQGKVLFELAPLDAWRVILKVDERDIAHVQANQEGDLVLAGLSGVRQRFTVKRVTAVAVAEEGRNHFRVEAELKAHDVKLRPGMEGVAKVEVGSASAFWVATHRLGDWLRLTLWEWLP
jgi:RND family efflux transporter MFP subunit